MNYFCCRNFRIYEQNQEYFLDDPFFKLVAIQKMYQQNFEKQLQRNPVNYTPAVL